MKAGGIFLRRRSQERFLSLHPQSDFPFFCRIIVNRQRLPPLIGLNQYDRTRLTHLKRSDDKSSLSIQFFQIVYQTYRSFRLCQQTGNFLPRNTVNSKRLLPLNKCINSCQITYFFVGHLFFITLLTTRMEDTSLFVEVNTSTFHTWDERPLCTIVPTARTVSPSCAEDI